MPTEQERSPTNKREWMDGKNLLMRNVGDTKTDPQNLFTEYYDKV